MSESTATDTAAMIEHALAYARAGHAVLPLAPRGKVPVTAHGKDDASTDPEVIRRWWQRNPRYNIGVRPPAGTVVLDIDPRNGGSIAELGDLPETWTARTGGGGWHLWFRCGGTTRGQVDGAAGIDIKTHSGYVVVPPSLHPGGGRYRWANRAGIADLPEHLRERVRPALVLPYRRATQRRRGTGTGEGLARFVRQAGAGNRNNALFWAASRAYADQASPDVLEAIADAGEAAGLSQLEVERTMASARKQVAA
ncbi:bifunctional DNA primase/polymerase [Nocardia terpenica]|uniref:bifunctional DNA primase/polymerase n=1 Tax=Nocardia terpenica TaxID=455432 RepID=UPI001894505F|nr:bifunctional DNA primase/polymerase [Nocardia terpenica]MBF6065028.1 bifunctional DNA primase/polymerase [Nocardia terpenica]MBF6108085.1 bifunctional DNA primase/polymerase [Nocardia terpenica]MBF6115300.1 bifunctional DNA primase/polymerase [Nocardia terpenica]MBF6122622.1 bifunctional DNA primase/polymerase [Nocardia terpenica]